MIDVAKATLDELLAEFIRLGNALSVTAKERLVILTELEARRARAAAKVRLRGLDSNEKDALRRELTEGR